MITAYGYATIEKAKARAERRGETVIARFRDGSYGSYRAGEIHPKGSKVVAVSATAGPGTSTPGKLGATRAHVDGCWTEVAQ